MGEWTFTQTEAIKVKEMRKRLSMDISFLFDGSEWPHAACGVCRRRYNDLWIQVPLSGWRGAEWGEKYAQEGVFYFLGLLCGDCLLFSPTELAAKIRIRAEKILRKPNTRRKQRNEAEGMIEFSGELEKVGSLKDLPGGILAVKIGEAYREIAGRHRPGKKAA